MRKFTFTVIAGLLASTSSLSAAVDFARDIQPIFAKHCYECHGPEQQKGDLRLDQRDAVLKSGTRVVVPADADKSELIRRISLPQSHEDVMPSRGEPLPAAEIQMIRTWIREGAVWPETVTAAKHWSYVPPNRPSQPRVKGRKWVKNPIDTFVLARLEKENLRPSAEADRTTLLRRVYLDLIGLPPSPAEVDAFLADKSTDAYEKVVNKLLNSSQYGERWARPWLDLARYADSSGYQRDNLWEIWPYRDWVIRALNQDMPFNQFTIEQIAGDLLPNATEEQKVATGFNRCVPTNVEAGSDQEETRVNQVFDRVNTLGAVWLGTTLECAQCHNHKYDPISQKEYFQLFAFFNNTAQETDRLTPKATASLKLIGPYLDLPDQAIEQQRMAINKRIEEVTRQIDERSRELSTRQIEWEEMLQAEESQTAIHPLDILDFDSESGSFHRILEDKSALLIKHENDAIPQRDTYKVTVRTKVSGITGFKLEILADSSLPGGGPGRGDPVNPNFVLNEFTAAITPEGSTTTTPVQLSAPIASFSQINFPVTAAIDRNPKSGWAIRPEFSKDHWAMFETVQPIGSASGSTLVFTLAQNNGSGRTIGRFRLSAITGTAAAKSIPSDVMEILRKPAAQRNMVERTRLESYHLAQDATLGKLKSERAKLQSELKKVKSPQTMVMQELPQPRMSTVFKRGSFLDPGEPVKPETPAVLHPFTATQANRLTLAQWLVSTNNPLAARVTVNRWWAEFFGHGLVRTPEDFGMKGDRPTHPELLDWLATEFMQPAASESASPSQPWSMKHIHRLIVTSATYRQLSIVSPRLLAVDDQNKLYARGSRFRMEAEMIRDYALSVAGLLSLKKGGPPVRPYQPDGLWDNKVGGDPITYNISEGEDRYRRGIYVVWKRTSPYPSFINFDATERTACTIKRSRSNTPQQALTLLNDPVYVEAAAGLAKRLLHEQSSKPIKEKIEHAALICLGRRPSAKETTILKRLYQDQLKAAQQDPGAAEQLLAPYGIPHGIDVPEFAAWHAVAWALLNLDETITKG